MSDTVKIPGSVSAANDAIARQNRLFFAAHGLRVLNLISSPGSGKTSILERMALTYGPTGGHHRRHPDHARCRPAEGRGRYGGAD